MHHVGLYRVTFPVALFRYIHICICIMLNVSYVSLYTTVSLIVGSLQMVPIQTQKGIIGQTAMSVTTRILAKFSQLREENLQLKLDLIMRTCMRLFLVASPHSGLAIAKRRCLIINLIRVDMMSLLVNGGTQTTVRRCWNRHKHTSLRKGVRKRTCEWQYVERAGSVLWEYTQQRWHRKSAVTPRNVAINTFTVAHSLAYLCVFGYFLNLALLASSRLAVSRGSAEMPCARCLRGASVGLSGTSTLLYLSNWRQSCWMRSSRSSSSCSRRRIVSSRSRTSFCSSPALAIMSGGGATMCAMCVSDYADVTWQSSSTGAKREVVRSTPDTTRGGLTLASTLQLLL